MWFLNTNFTVHQNINTKNQIICLFSQACTLEASCGCIHWGLYFVMAYNGTS